MEELDGKAEAVGVEEVDGVDEEEVACGAEADEGLTGVAPVSELPLALDSPVV